MPQPETQPRFLLGSGPQSNPNTDFCTICLSTVHWKHQPTTTQACDHTFHTWCLLRWYLYGPKPCRESCPMCRTNFFEKNGYGGQAFWNTLTAEEKIEIGNKMIRRKNRELYEDANWEEYLNSVQLEKIADEHDVGTMDFEDGLQNTEEEEDEDDEDEELTYDETYWWAFVEG